MPFRRLGDVAADDDDRETIKGEKSTAFEIF